MTCGEPIPEHLHGKALTYQKRACRCRKCTAAQARKIAQWRAAAGAAPPDSHGKWATYSNYRCRCALCMEAMREYKISK